MKLFKREKSAKEILLDYLRDVLNEASIKSDDLDLYVIGQYNYESEDQCRHILERVSTGDYEYCRGYHDSRLTNDLVIIYLAVSGSACKMLIVYDPFELFDSPSLIGEIAIKDCSRALKSTIKEIV